MAFPSAVYFIIWKMTQETILRKLSLGYQQFLRKAQLIFASELISTMVMETTILVLITLIATSMMVGCVTSASLR
jgi:hypothetical protein